MRIVGISALASASSSVASDASTAAMIGAIAGCSSSPK